MRKALIAGVVIAVALAIVGIAGFALEPTSAVQPITAESACPATGCASGTCHGFDNVPDPDGIHEMVCPEIGCASVECHAWDSLTGRYHQASDMSLNVWILMPVVLVLGLWLLTRTLSKGGSREDS